MTQRGWLAFLLAVATIAVGGTSGAAFAEDAAAAGGYAFYDDGNSFLAAVEPILIGEEGFLSRARASSGGDQPLGLVLSGGSARAFAHIGVLRALEEEGIRPDYIVADSMGAIVALLYGAGLSPRDIEALFEDFPAASLFDPVIPTAGGFLDQSRFSATLRALVGDLDLADLPIPVMVLCEDLPTRRQVRIAAGDFVSVMAAAFALPGVFAPVAMGEHVLIDGGVTALVPAEAAYAYGSRVIVATALYGKKLNYKSAFVVLNRAIDIGKTRRSVEELLARRPPVIRCDVEELSYMKFSDPAEVARRGYESARAAMSEVLAVAGPARPPSASLEATRAAYHRKLEALSAAGRREAAFPLDAGFAVKPVLRFADEAREWRGAYDGRRFAGAAAEIHGGPAAVSLAALAGLEGDADRVWGLSAKAALRNDIGAVYESGSPFGAALEVLAEGLLSGGVVDESPEARSLAGAARASVGIGPVAGLVVRPFAETEAEAALPEWTGARWAIESGLEFETAREAKRMTPSGSSLDAFLAPAFFADSDGNRGPGAEAWASLAFGGIAALRLRAAARATHGGPGIGANAMAGFRGPPLGGASPTRAYGGLELAALGTSLAPDFREMLIVEKPEFGLFSECAYAGPFPGESGDVTIRPVIGLSLSFDASLLGLSPLGLSAYACCGLDGSGWAFGLRTGRYFR